MRELLRPFASSRWVRLCPRPDDSRQRILPALSRRDSANKSYSSLRVEIAKDFCSSDNAGTIVWTEVGFKKFMCDGFVILKRHRPHPIWGARNLQDFVQKRFSLFG